MRSNLERLITSAALVAFSADCYRTPMKAQAERGRELMATAGCGACHVVSGVPGATGLIGPPLTGIALRTYVAGVLPNTPEQLAAWIQRPQSIKPGTAMPDLGLSDRQAADIAAYLSAR